MNNLPYRQGANAIVIDSNNKYLLVQKLNYKDNEWDFPGGGVAESESPSIAILRELEEELGSKDFEILHKSSITNRFDWPEQARQRAFEKRGKWFRGQEKTMFVVEFIGNKEDLEPQENEIRNIKWVSYDELSDHLVFDGQWESVKKVIDVYHKMKNGK